VGRNRRPTSPLNLAGIGDGAEPLDRPKATEDEEQATVGVGPPQSGQREPHRNRRRASRPARRTRTTRDSIQGAEVVGELVVTLVVGSVTVTLVVGSVTGAVDPGVLAWVVPGAELPGTELPAEGSTVPGVST